MVCFCDYIGLYFFLFDTPKKVGMLNNTFSKIYAPKALALLLKKKISRKRGPILLLSNFEYFRTR